jgi:hypothetical protein
MTPPLVSTTQLCACERAKRNVVSGARGLGPALFNTYSWYSQGHKKARNDSQSMCNKCSLQMGYSHFQMLSLPDGCSARLPRWGSLWGDHARNSRRSMPAPNCMRRENDWASHFQTCSHHAIYVEAPAEEVAAGGDGAEMFLRESCCVGRLQGGAAGEMTFWPPRDPRGQNANSKVKLAFAQHLQGAELDMFQPRRRCHENGLCIKRFETMISNCSVGSKAQSHALAEISLAVSDEHVE